MKVYYSPDYTIASHAFDTTRKASWIAESLRGCPIPGILVEAPEPLSESQLCEVHDPAYVAAVRTGEPRDLAQTQGFPWDPGLWTMVRSSNGGAVQAARTALREGVAGSLSSGLHHAKRGRGDGFCTFNGLVLAARAATADGAKSILILDLDAHCGGGTDSLIRDDPRIRQLDVAVSPFDEYRPGPFATLDVVADASLYLPTVRSRLEDLTEEFDLCLYNAGMDPYQGCTIGGLEGITQEVLRGRERMVFEWAQRRGVPVAFVLAGGYVSQRLSREELVDLHRLTLEAAYGP